MSQSSRLVVLPPGHEIRDALFHWPAMQNIANHRARSRTASISIEHVCEQASSHPSGVVQANGGGVSNSYRQRAASTVLGVAWFTDPANRLHVRLVADRVSAPKSSHGHRSPAAFSDKKSPAVCVYPELSPPPVLQSWRKVKRNALPSQLLAAIDADCLDLVAWSAWSDWLQDHEPAELWDLPRLRTGASKAVAQLREIHTPAISLTSNVGAS